MTVRYFWCCRADGRKSHERQREMSLSISIRNKFLLLFLVRKHIDGLDCSNSRFFFRFIRLTPEKAPRPFESVVITRGAIAGGRRSPGSQFLVASQRERGGSWRTVQRLGCSIMPVLG